MRMVNLMQTTTIDYDMFKEVDMDGVVATVAAIFT